MLRSARIATIVLAIFSTLAAHAQIATWQLGGASGLAWSAIDSTQILIDFSASPRAIQPVYIQRDSSILALFDNWSPLKLPRQLGYIDGERARAWKGSLGDERPVHNGTYLVDGDSTTFNPPGSGGIGGIWYTIDLAVPVPAERFGFFTPPRGFRADGQAYAQDAIPAYEVSIAPEAAPSFSETNAYQRVGQVVANVAENLAPRVRIDFPRQYVRFVRFQRKESILDQAYGLTSSSASGAAQKGTIADFELFGEGVPRRALYKSQIIDLGNEVNFGRLHWAATAMRMVDGQPVEDPQARVWVEVETRIGSDDDPNIYQEYDDKGREVEVSRQRFDLELKESQSYSYVASGRPGVRASILYDSDNWSFWSSPIAESGRVLNLRPGSRLQLRVTLHSEEFDAFVRLDSLWLETSPLLAAAVYGEVARRDDQQPKRGYTEVALGEMTSFVYDIKADFSSAAQTGFDAIRIRTGARPTFESLELGEPLSAITPLEVIEEEDALLIALPERITAANNAQLRVGFSSQLRIFAATFTGEILDDESTNLPQSIQEGNASTALSTNSLRILSSSETQLDIVRDLTLSTPVLTPNGDGTHDRLRIDYTLFRLTQTVPVDLRIYSLAGRLLATRSFPAQTTGPQHIFWDGRDESGQLLPPGLYLLELKLQTEASSQTPLRTIGLAY